MGYPPGSVNESQHRMGASPWGNRPMVLQRQYGRGMEVDGLSLVDLWQTYDLRIHPHPPLMSVHILSGVGKDHPLVRHLSSPCISTNLPRVLVPQSYKTSQF